MPKQIYLTEDAARRVASTVRAVERQVLPFERGDRPPRNWLNAYYAIVTEAIGAGDPATKTLGKGMIRLQLINVTTSGGTTTYSYEDWPGLDPLICLNGGDGVDVGSLIQVKMIDGFFNVDVHYC